MKPTTIVSQMLGAYSDRNPAVVRNLAAMLNYGQLSGTGKVMILPVDQDIEHGPRRLWRKNEAGYENSYPFRLAVEAGASALATTMDRIAICAREWSHQVPIIAKLNSSNPLGGGQTILGSPKEARDLGCAAIGYTVYPGDADYREQMETFTRFRAEAHELGLFTVLWAYPRGGIIGKDEQNMTALDVTSMAVKLARHADVIKVKLPEGKINILESTPEADRFSEEGFKDLLPRLQHLRAVADGRIIVFSGGEPKEGEGDEGYLKKMDIIRESGCNGPIVGRRASKREFDKAVEFFGQIAERLKKAA